MCQYVPKRRSMYSVLLYQIEPDLVFVFDLIVAFKSLSICVMEINIIRETFKTFNNKDSKLEY